MASGFLQEVMQALEPMPAGATCHMQHHCLWLELPHRTKALCFLSFRAMQLGVITGDALVLSEDAWLRNRDAVLSRVASRLGRTRRVHARQCVLQRVPAAQARAFFAQHHLMGYATAYYHYALMYKGEAVAMAAFSKGRKMRRLEADQRSYELVRFCNASYITVVGGFSKLLQHFIREVHPADIMTYIDATWAESDAYLRQGFRFDTQQPPRGVFIDTKTGMRIPAATNTAPPDEGCVYYEGAGNIKLIWNAQHTV